MTHQIIIDTDPGIDDALAIFYALNAPGIEVMGLTTVFGNVATDLSTKNALRLLEIADRQDIPVAAGAKTPLVRPFRGGTHFVHGNDGQGNVNLPDPTLERFEESAAEFIIEQVMYHPGEITLVPIGPLTNIALALRLEPRIVENVKGVVLMGGAALVPGNSTPAGEANIYNDPEAAELVFNAGWDVTMLGLDVTTMLLMTSEQAKRYATSQKATSQHLSKIVPHYINFHRMGYGLDGMFIHDSAVISYLLAPDAFKVEQYPLVVATDDLSRGKTWVWTNPREPISPWQGRKPVNVCVDVDVARVIDMELSFA